MMRTLAIAILMTVAEATAADANSFQGFWTSSKGIWVNVFVTDSKATGYTNGANFTGSIQDSQINWEQPADASGEIWHMGPDGKVTDSEGDVWTRSVVTTTPPSTTTSTTTKTPWGPKWLHAIGLSRGEATSPVQHSATPKGKSSAKMAWVLPVLGAAAMFSFVALVTSRMQRTRSTRIVSTSEAIAMSDLDEEFVVE
jgi:hypothetical protein